METPSEAELKTSPGIHKEAVGAFSMAETTMKQKTGESLPGLSLDSCPLGKAQKASPNREMQKSEQLQTSRFQEKQKSGQKKNAKSRISHQNDQNSKFQSLISNSQTDSPQPEPRQDAEMNQGSSTAEPGVREPEEGCEKPDCLYSPVLCPVNEGVVVKIMSDRDSGLLKAGEYFNVCDKFLMGRCQKNSGCLYYHTLLPFYWQIFSKKNCSWCSLSFRTQLYLEMLFSSPGYFTRVSPKLNDATSFVDMVLPTFYLSCDFQHNFYRRIPCRGDSSFPPIYILYWFNGQVWSYLSQKIPHETPIVETQKLESTRSYGSGALSAMASGHPSLSSPSPLLMYWLKYIPLHELVPNIRIWNLEKPKDLSIWDENALDSCLESYSELSNKVMIPREKHFLLMEMLPSEPAYQYCCRLFFCSMNCKESAILRIFRLYNPKLWKKYKRVSYANVDRVHVHAPIQDHVRLLPPSIFPGGQEVPEEGIELERIRQFQIDAIC